MGLHKERLLYTERKMPLHRITETQKHTHTYIYMVVYVLQTQRALAQGLLFVLRVFCLCALVDVTFASTPPTLRTSSRQLPYSQHHSSRFRLPQCVSQHRAARNSLQEYVLAIARRMMRWWYRCRKWLKRPRP